MLNIKVKVLVIGCILLTGCASTYQANRSFGGNGGFEETELAPNYFRITFKGNAHTSADRVHDFALLRASELMGSRGCWAFEVVKSNSEVREMSFYMPKTQSTNATVSSFGNTAYGNATTTTYGGNEIKQYFPRTSIDVKCSKKEVDIENGIFDTEFIQIALKQKYKIS
ncbi:MAG: hypothetical protein RSC68_06010 [Acinetobacter sp.]